MFVSPLSYRCEWELVPEGGINCYVKHKSACNQRLLQVGEVALHVYSDNPNVWWCQECTFKHLHITPTTYGYGYKPTGVTQPQSKPKSKPKPKLPKSLGPCLGCGQLICELCKRCENPECKFYGYLINTQDKLADVKYKLAKTQKIQGVIALVDEGFKVPHPYNVVLDKDDIEHVYSTHYSNYPYGKAFVRPCPIRSRHGFVESRVVDLHDEEVLYDIWDEVRKADSEGELLLMPYVEAEYNIVMTPTRLTVGEHHDGATNGKKCVSLPLSGVPFGDLKPEVIKRAGIDVAKEDPYIEAIVSDYERIIFTQLRAGVKLPKGIGQDYIPKAVEVKKVIKATGDLLEWEEKIKGFEEGTVVSHVGGSLVSHYSVHCIYNGIPILTSRAPRIGETLRATATVEFPNHEALRRGIGIGIQSHRLDEGNAKQALLLTLAIAHNATAMSGEFSVWLGMAVGIMLRLGMAASHGEARHGLFEKSEKPSREHVYRTAFPDFLGSRNTLGEAFWLFNNHVWSSTFGGPKWAKCTKAVMDLEAATRMFLREPTNEHITDIITTLHQAINQVHNSGWWLNKFHVSEETFDRFAKQDAGILCHAAEPLYQWNDEIKESKTQDKLLNTWMELNDIEVRKPKRFIDGAAGDDEDEDNDTKDDDNTDDLIEPADNEVSTPEPEVIVTTGGTDTYQSIYLKEIQAYAEATQKQEEQAIMKSAAQNTFIKCSLVDIDKGDIPF